MTSTPLQRLLTGSLLVAPVVYLIADVLYATRGWDDPTAGVVHVLAAAGYTVVMIRLATLGDGPLAVALLLAGVLGAAGDVAYGFNTIHVSLGDTDLVDASGAAVLIKPLGLCFPLTLLLGAVMLRHRVPAWAVALVAAGGLLWPVAHIANLGWLAVLTNLLLTAAFGAAAVSLRQAAPFEVTRPVIENS
ncbi:hypothetical protein Ait01nite_025440 [Actinoplanes italicus]|uniref:Uncharacterized protein n=1 Tax=Actinoplanes italicus TaxID=113567 RepID=A0A2T0KFD1_9ACTN|nr:hypothetical protein [Actinoplanes italicus]PRX22085.1 hypothetical protein CLV67_105262 [Actinoplanes italicus]GIE29499.1 hypothetical protein Ait01nite_025440 [Actinoplanes italicus]